MRTLVLSLIIIFATLNLGCETRLFKYTVSVDQTGDFIVDDGDGVYIATSFISRTSIARAFNLPSGARVTELKIESLSISVNVAETNTANAVTVTGYLGRTPTSTETLFRQFPIVLSGSTVPGIGLNDLIESKIAELQTTLENFVKGIGTGTLVELAIAGTSTPAGRRIAFTIHMHIKASVKYERCEDILIGMSNAPACSESETGH